MSRRKTKKESEENKVFSEKRGKDMERAQIWSIDVLLAIVIFISIMIIFYVTITSNQKPTINDLQGEAGFLRTELEQNEEHAFLEGDVVNTTKLAQFVEKATKDYSSVKEKLGVRGDFCIYFSDEQGNVYILQNSTGGMNLTGMGKGDINISDTPCGENKVW